MTLIINGTASFTKDIFTHYSTYKTDVQIKESDGNWITCLTKTIDFTYGEAKTMTTTLNGSYNITKTGSYLIRIVITLNTNSSMDKTCNMNASSTITKLTAK